MLRSTSSKEALLVCPPFPPWNLPSFDPPLSFVKVQLSHTVSATSLYVYIDPLIMCRVSAFRLPDTVLGVVSDYVISLLVAIQLL